MLALVALTACAGASGTTGGGAPTASTAGVARVDSALCDDLRAVVRARTEGPAADVRVREASGRVLVALGASSGAPEDVVVALRTLEGGGAADDAVDATVASWTAQQCGGS